MWSSSWNSRSVRHGLHIKLALIVSAGALVLAALSSWWFYRSSYQDSLQQSARSVQQLMATVRQTAEIAAYVGNRELAKQVATGLVLNDIVLGATLINDSGVQGQAGKSLSSEQIGVMRLTLHSPFDADDAVGELLVLPNRAHIEQEANAAARATTIGLVTHTFIVAFLVLIVVYLMLTRPLVQLSRGLHQIVPGSDARLTRQGAKRGDEIGQLAGDINRLLDAVENMLGQERALRERLEALEQRFRGIFEGSSAGIFLMQENGVLITANPAFFRLAGLTDQSLPAGDFNCIQAVFAEPDIVMSMVQLTIHSGRPCASDFRLRQLKDEQPCWVHGMLSANQSAEDGLQVEGVIYDITDRKRAEDNSRFLAEYDPLTELLNRRSGEQQAIALLQHAEKEASPVAVMMLDLDRFKEINDSHGHEAGDEVLRAVAKRIRGVVRSGDITMRLGGDEFLLVMKNSTQRDTLQRIAGTLISRIGEPIAIAPERQDQVGVSIGIALFPQHSREFSVLAKQADEAMYAVKRQGRNGYAIYRDDSHHEVQLFGVS